MPTISSSQIPPPSNWQDFEEFCCDLWRQIWGDPNAQRNGRQGQPQNGVDIYGRPKQGDLMERTGERYYEAEIHRLKGELLLKQSNGEAAAEECFRRAIDVARHQRSKVWELRAVISLSRLLSKLGRRGEARQELMRIYSWFAEGFGMEDLKKARELLEGN